MDESVVRTCIERHKTAVKLRALPSRACDLLQRVEARLLLAAQRGVELVQGGFDQLGGRQHGPTELTSSFSGRTDVGRTCCWLDPVANDPKRTWRGPGKIEARMSGDVTFLHLPRDATA